MKVHVLTLFPNLIENFLHESIMGIAREKSLLEVSLHDYRDATNDKHRTVDDRPFGGGPGMVIKPEPVFTTIENVIKNSDHPQMPLIMLTPQGERFGQGRAQWLSEQDEWLVLCGRYEGFDERIHQGFPWIEVSLGDFVLSGGEIAALGLIEASTRLIPGVLGHHESALQDSFTSGKLDHPHYTRPRSFRGEEVPETLLNGNHEEIKAWRGQEAQQRTETWHAEHGEKS